jgi:hypothetical protein
LKSRLGFVRTFSVSVLNNDHIFGHFHNYMLVTYYNFIVIIISLPITVAARSKA